MSTNEEFLRDMIKELRKYLMRLKLHLNVGKTKIMVVGKTRRIKKIEKKEYLWNKEKI